MFNTINMQSLIVVLICLLSHAWFVNPIEFETEEVRNLALKFGNDISRGSEQSTCYGKIAANFEELRAKVVWIDANKMMEDMRIDVLNMMNWKKISVEKIANESENLAVNKTDDKNLNYHNMKKIFDDSVNSPNSGDSSWSPLRLSKHPNFENATVNLEHSAIHVPINVYENTQNILNDIKWSDGLTTTFKNNMAFDPSLSWQFFGSSTGFLRLYPATRWEKNNEYNELNLPDLYDCRMRPWYIQAAASPKDVVLLMDTSGSMTGLRKEIAKNVAITILDTLRDDDYVAAIGFSCNLKFIPECFNETMVQANERNLMEIKENLNEIIPSDISNFQLALTKAFELLQSTHKANLGAQCNQAIMLITDGAPDTYDEVFQKFNWPNIPVRVFTYLIGREVTDSKEVNMMACQNRGYYTHIANLAEVREQVQQYIPVMSRPLVLSKERIFVWTPVYADISHMQLNDWVWEEVQKAKAKRKIKLLQQVIENQNAKSNDDEKDEQEINGINTPLSQLLNDEDIQSTINADYPKKCLYAKKNLQLMTTLATAVFDTRLYKDKQYRELVKNEFKDKVKQIRIADILGIAGIDVPIKEIVKLTPQFKLGVNGYSFIITNNGFLLYHPELRPLYQDLVPMLKPYYSSVDISEVELADNGLGARELDPDIKDIRENMINRTHGWKKVAVKIHLDCMKRVVTRTNNYIYGSIDNTPFSLAIVLPEPYGSYRVEGQVEVKRKDDNFTQYFRGKQWRVHPDWVYCENPNRRSGIERLYPEEPIEQFLKLANNGHSFRWKTSSTRPQVYDKMSCDKDLIQSLVFDAKATDIEGRKCDIPNSKIEDKTVKLFGVVTTFVATRSGLTRYEDHRNDDEKLNLTGEPPFYELYNKAIDEIYYRRAVDFHNINDSAFVFSVPFDANTMKGPILVTGSRAIFIGSGKSRAPAAVVGLQIKHSSFSGLFFNLSKKFKLDCDSDELECYLLDNNAFVIVSENPKNTGIFFGELDNSLLEAMVTQGVYRKVHLYDYQAICLETESTSALASMLITPYRHLRNIFVWLWTRIILIYMQVWYNSWSVDASDYIVEDYEQENQNKNNKIKPKSCDKEFFLYEVQRSVSDEPIKGVHSQCHPNDCQQNFIVQYVPYTNLVMLVVYKSCPCQSSTVKLEPQKIEYSDNSSERCSLLFSERYRKRPTTCHNYHPKEKEIEECGKGSNLVPSLMLLTFLCFISIV